MNDVICLSVDAESGTGAPIAERFGVTGYPALLFLEADGSERDRISGYMPPGPFQLEVQRIKRNEGTFRALEKKVEANPADLEARFQLATKLRSRGDQAGAKKHCDEILRLDPQGKTAVARKVMLGEKIQAAGKSLDATAIYDFIAQETDGSVLYMGWSFLWRLESRLAKQGTDAAVMAEHLRKSFAAARILWKHVPEAEAVQAGNSIAWAFWEGRDALTEDDKAFALMLAEKAALGAPTDANTIDTYACCLFMAGQKDAAVVQVKRCLELDPENADWTSRLAEFQK